jgi:hypothetical protein
MSLKLFTATIAEDDKRQATTTVLEQLSELSIADKTVQDPDSLLDKDLASHLGDMEISLPERILLLNLYNLKFQENIVEIITKLNTMYLFSRTKYLAEYLEAIVLRSDIDPFLKVETARNLAEYSERGFHCIDYVLVTYPSIPTPIRLEAIYALMTHDGLFEKAMSYYESFLVDQSIDCLYRYKSIINLETQLKDHAERYVEVARRACRTFLDCKQNMTYYRTLAVQYIFRKCSGDVELQQLGLDALFGFATDIELDYNLRADAVDVLLNVDDKTVVARANLILMELGANGRTVRSIFENAQNVHQKSIEDSARGMIDFLSTIPNPKAVDFATARDKIVETGAGRDVCSREKVNMALTRILIDRAVYGTASMTLHSILVKVWLFIDGHEHRSALVERLLDELIDSSEVCSTGYAHRLVNVLSGFTEQSLSISFEEQVAANLQGRLNAIIRDIEDADYQSLIITEMLIPVIHYHLRGNFLKFFRESISRIREAMYQEFRDHISDTDYDLYFRKAIMVYEGVM